MIAKKRKNNFFLPTRFFTKKERVFEIDFLRGFDIFLMILVHATFTLGFGATIVFTWPNGMPLWINKGIDFFRFIFVAITQPAGSASNAFLMHTIGYSATTNLFALEAFFAGLFMFLCGISCTFSKSNLSRGMKLAYVSALMTIGLEFISFLIPPFNFHIYWGILQSMSAALLIYTLFDHFFPKWYHDLIFIIPLIIINACFLWFSYSQGQMDTIKVTEASTFSEFSLNCLGLFFGKFRDGNDYFPPLLVTLVLFLGAIVGKTLYKDKKSLLRDDFPKAWSKPILFIGKHTLIIYLSHQIILFIILGIVFLPLGAAFNE